MSDDVFSPLRTKHNKQETKKKHQRAEVEQDVSGVKSMLDVLLTIILQFMKINRGMRSTVAIVGVSPNLIFFWGGVSSQRAKNTSKVDNCSWLSAASRSLVVIPLESCRFLVVSITSVSGLRSLTAGCLTTLLVVSCRGSLQPILRMSVVEKGPLVV